MARSGFETAPHSESHQCSYPNIRQLCFCELDVYKILILSCDALREHAANYIGRGLDMQQRRQTWRNI